MGLESLGGSKRVENTEGEIGWLKQNALELTKLYLSGEYGGYADDVKYEPNTWNENSGVIVFADNEGRQYAIPSTDRVREKLQKDLQFKKAEGKGVISLNEVDSVWGGAEKNAHSGSFNRWKELSLASAPVQARESDELIAGQRLAREEMEAELNPITPEEEAILSNPDDPLNKAIRAALKESTPPVDPERGLVEALRRIREMEGRGQ